MARSFISRREALIGGALAAAAALGTGLAGCGSEASTGTGSSEGSISVASSTMQETSPADTSAAASGTLLETIETKGDLAYAVNFAKGSLSPWGADAETAACINRPVLEGLYEYDPITSTTYPALAGGEPEETISNVYRIALREYALFSDGSPVTSEDVVASFELARKSAAGPFAYLLSLIETIEADGEDAVTVVTKVAMGRELEERLSLVKVVPKATKRKQLKDGVIGTGPWRIESIDDERAVYVPNSFYTGTHPAMANTMTCYFSTDMQARADALLGKDVQAIEDAPTDNEKFGERRSGITVETVAGFNPALLVFNTRQAPFDDALVRQAVLAAIDGKALAKDVFGGNAHAATSFINKGNPDYCKASHVYAGNPEKAQGLLREAGIDDLSFVLDTGEEPWMWPAALKIAEDLEAAGIAVEIHTMPLPELYAGYMDGDEDVQIFSAALVSAAPGTLGNDIDLLIRWFFTNDTWMRKRSSWKGSDGYRELQELLVTAEAAADDEREKAWGAVLDLISEQVPLYPVVHRDKVTAYRASALEGFEPIGTAGIDMLDTSIA